MDIPGHAIDFTYADYYIRRIIFYTKYCYLQKICQDRSGTGLQILPDIEPLTPAWQIHAIRVQQTMPLPW